jgi:AcrR family transcriptional regulator
MGAGDHRPGAGAELRRIERSLHDGTQNRLVAVTVLLGATRRALSRDPSSAEAMLERATLYKYFPDVGSILRAWHERQIDDHLKQLVQVRDQADGAAQRLEAVLTAFAAIAHQRHDTDLAALLHRGEHVTAAHQHLHEFIRDLVAEAAETGAVRQDIPADELTLYCLHALTAAGSLNSPPAVRRLVQATLTGLQASNPEQ